MTTKAQPDPVAALLTELPATRRLTAEEVRDVRESLAAGHKPIAIAGRLQIPVYVVCQISTGKYYSVVE